MGTSTQPVSGIVTANAGIGNFTVIQGIGTNLHVVVDTAPTTTVTGTITANAGTGFGINTQASTTAGQSGQLTLCAVTTAAPSYTTALSNPCSLDTAGNLRTVGTLTGTFSFNLAQINAGTVATVATGVQCVAIVDTSFFDNSATT